MLQAAGALIRGVVSHGASTNVFEHPVDHREGCICSLMYRFCSSALGTVCSNKRTSNEMTRLVRLCHFIQRGQSKCRGHQSVSAYYLAPHLYIKYKQGTGNQATQVYSESTADRITYHNGRKVKRLCSCHEEAGELQILMKHHRNRRVTNN